MHKSYNYILRNVLFFINTFMFLSWKNYIYLINFIPEAHFLKETYQSKLIYSNKKIMRSIQIISIRLFGNSNVRIGICMRLREPNIEELLRLFINSNVSVEILWVKLILDVNI